MEVKGKEFTFIRIVFAPAAAKVYSATITIQSNAENASTKAITLSGRGLAKPDGGTSCP